MRPICRSAGALTSCLLLLAATSAHADPITVWTRANGNYTKGPLEKVKPQVVDLKAEALEERECVDAQYDGARRRYQGIPLALVLERARSSSKTDLALLHFVNGMIIPLPLERSTLTRVDAFLAKSTWVVSGPGDAGAWSSDFPIVEKRDIVSKDNRPIRFTGNKLVVKSGWHPMVSPSGGSTFSPWLYSDSLSGIELVESAAYYRQFQVASDDDSGGGYAVFLGRCQFCHGARTLGATFGWDFVEPVPIHTYRTPESLFLHVRYRDGLAPEKGLMMPAFKDLGPKDAKALWSWIKEVAERPMPPYAAAK